MVENDVTILQKKGEDKKEYNSEVKLNDIKLPVKKGEVIGKLLIKDDMNTIKQVNLVSSSDMEKKSFFNTWFNLLKSVLTGDLI